VIESAGKNVKLYKKGDKVFGYTGQKMGAYAEYISLPEKNCMAIKPDNMTFEEAAVVSYGGIMAVNFLKKMKIKQGQKILIIGASGAIGSAAVQLAKYYGAEVTGVCSTGRVDYVRSLGADKVIDYNKEDFSKADEKYDLIIDILGRSSFLKCKPSLKQKGCYLLTSFKMKQIFQMFVTSLKGGKEVKCLIAPGSVGDLIEIKKLIESGKLKSIIDKSFTLEQASVAHWYAEEGKAKGKVVITI
jgi:NADPH:quinone reductase-like Zn-dependent oxidoreductase